MSSRRGRRWRPLDGDALGYVGYFAELIDEWAPENDPNETLFRLGASIVEAMAAGVPIEPLARYFEFWLLRLQGVYQADPRAVGRGARRFSRPRAPAVRSALGDVPVSPRSLRELEASHQRADRDAPRKGSEVGAKCCGKSDER